jgi:GNAT superfamily N-acetyltransferase
MTISTDSRLDSVVWTAGPDKTARLATVLAQAFYDDPVFAWFFPRERRRFERIERFFARLALERSTMPHGHVYTTADLAGAALWLPPGQAHSTTWEQLRMLPELARVAGRDLPRVLRGMGMMEQEHPHEPHWYLWFVGVAPERRGAGLGSALMRPILERCDDGMPAYLEATSPDNRRLYERHGFEVTGELRLPNGPPMWPMWRAS